MQQNPLEVLYSWQSLFLAVIISAITQALKTTIDIYYGSGSGGRAHGAVIRKSSLLMTGVLLPSIPIVFGMAMAVLVPVRPDPLESYVSQHHDGPWVYAMWGGSVGQFADYIYQRIKKFITDNQTSGTVGS